MVRLSRSRLLILLSPISLPAYLLVQAAVFVTAACYYLLFSCGLERLLGRPVKLSPRVAYAVAPLVIGCAPVVLLVQLGVWLVGAVGGWLVGVGRWQSGLSGRLAAVAGLIWSALMLWVVLACLSPPSGWAILGREVPGLAEHLAAVRDDLRLGDLPAPMQRRRERLIGRLRGRSGQEGFDFAAVADLADDQLGYNDLPLRYQKQIAGLPGYYHPPRWAEEGAGQAETLGGTLLLAMMLMIRWPGMHGLVSGAAGRVVGFLLRVAVATAVAVAAFVGRWEPVDRYALYAGVVLVVVAVAVVIYWLGSRALRSARLPRYYSAFIAARLLQRRRIAFFSVGAVTLCVAMVLIVVSVMGGFLDMVRRRSRGLLGDLVMENRRPLQGFPFYQEFIERITAWPEVEAATPVIYTYGIMRLHETGYTKAVRIVGIRLAETYRVNDFRRSLFYEKWYPGSTTLGEQRQALWGIDERTGRQLLPQPLERALASVGPPAEQFARRPLRPFPGPGVYAPVEAGPTGRRVLEALLDLMEMMTRQGELADQIERLVQGGAGSVGYAELAASQRELGETVGRMVEKLPEGGEFGSAREDLRAAGELLARASEQIGAGRAGPAARLQDRAWGRMEACRRLLRGFLQRPGYDGRPLPGVIIGVDLIAQRTASGRYHRFGHYPRGHKVDLTVVPLSPETGQPSLQGPLRKTFRYVDDSHTGVHEIDTFCVYVDFELLQKLIGMGPEQRTAEAGGGMAPARCSQIQIKLAAGCDPLAMRSRIQRAWQEFSQTMPASPFEQGLMADVEVLTWEQMQAAYIAAVEKEKILVTSLFGVISVVAVFLVLCIFYMIVQEKTRDIGIIKSIGGSAAGVAGIFLGYGAAIGTVGAILGTIVGVIFVRYINEIQEWLASIHPGMRVWSAEVYVFDRIPNQVKVADAAIIVAVAIVAAIIGAVIPALRAGRVWPAEALRYE